VAAALSDFHAAHAQRYGYAMPDEPTEAVTVRVRGTGQGVQPSFPRRPLAGADASAAQAGAAPVWFETSGPVRATLYNRDRLEPGNQLAGPAIVLQFDTTTVIPPGWSARVDELSNLWITRPEGEGR
ncbi:MAG: hydantoinase/oxoprolinase family protein, partial [Anaerolineae bacterium]|nr:hydantoinase/oxoprolinase family protein [Anaerolineae bacterium]